MNHVLSRTTAAAALSLGVVIGAGGAAAAATSVANLAAHRTAGGRIVTPHATGVVAHVYTVNTTTDDTLYGSAPPHRCQDQTNQSKCSLRAAIEVASDDFDANRGSWDVIKVPAGTYSLSASVDVSSLYFEYQGDLQIEGAGPTKTVINASSFDNAILDMGATYSTLAVSGVGFTGGYATLDGGAVGVSSDSDATFTDCAFTSNEAASNGGAINVGQYASLTVTDSTFTDNEAEYYGGAVFDEFWGSITLSGDTFTHNTTSFEDPNYGGGAVFVTAPLGVDHSTFKNNTAGGYGGAIYAEDNATITTSTFSGNRAEVDGGAVFASENLIFNNNDAASNNAEVGGAVYVDDVADLSGDTFRSNTAEYGGDIADHGDATVVNTTSTDATASDEGGSVYNYENTLNMTGVTISGARALGDDEGGGGVYAYEGAAFLTNVTITRSSAPTEAYGGGVYCYDCELTSVGGTYTHDSAEYDGGAIFLDDATLTANAMTVSDNTSEVGGGIYAYASSANVDDTTFAGNDAVDDWGGAVAIEYGGSTAITDSSLVDNRADGSDGYGGGIALYADGETTYGVLTNDTIAGNQADYAGGVYTNAADLAISSSTVADNTLARGSAADYGGGLYNNSSYVQSTDTIWSGNGGDQCGGSGISSSGGFNLDSDNSCGLYGAGDIVSHAAKLGPLQNNGGTTVTIAPLSGSLAIGAGGPSCPAFDQRGVAVPTGQACDIGSVFVASSVVTQAFSHPSVVYGAEQSETIKVTVTTKVGGAKPAGTVEVFAGSKLACVASVSNGKGQCALGAKTLKKGTYTFTSKYLGAGDVASSVSSNKSIKVT